MPPDDEPIDEFHALSQHRHMGVDSVVELINGEVCQLPNDDQLEQQILLLQRQIQQALETANKTANNNGGSNHDSVRFDVRVRYPLKIDDHCELKPALTIVGQPMSRSATADGSIAYQRQPQKERPLWVIDITKEGLNWRDTQRSKLIASAGISEYWCLTIAQVELRIYQEPTPAKYRECKLLQVGDSAVPGFIASASLLLPAQLTVRLQEPLPLHLLTRTLKGRKGYQTALLPLQVCSQ